MKKPCITLGIETSCDETSCALVSDGQKILGHLVLSQEKLHAHFGGVVPELASRAHIENLIPLLKKLFNDSKLSLEEVDAICVTQGPGLMGSLLVGMQTAKGLAFGTQKPLVGVNHIHAHLYAPFMEAKVPLPALGIVVSGGHSAFFLVSSPSSYKLIAQTQDDALGEAFDKVARILDLPYPGGPLVEKLALQGTPIYPFKAGNIKNNPYALSFSGLKTAVLYAAKGLHGDKPPLTEEEKCHVAASFQKAAFSNLFEKAMKSAKDFECQSFIFGGGVTQNQALRAVFQKSSFPCFFPDPVLCLDNAAMIAGLGYQLYLEGKTTAIHNATVYPTGVLCDI